MFDPAHCYGEYIFLRETKRTFSDDDDRIVTTTDAKRVRQKDKYDCNEMCSLGAQDAAINVVFVNEDDVICTTTTRCRMSNSRTMKESCNIGCCVHNNNVKWPKRHPGLFSEEGGVKNFIASCRRARDNNKHLV